MITETMALAATAVAFIVTVNFMFALRPVAARIGLVDRPGGRKFHSGNIPIVGGISMFAGAFSGLVMLGLPPHIIVSLITASLLLVVIGLIDDRFELTASARLASQFAATLIMMYGAGLALSDIGDPFGTGLITMGSATLVFTTLVTVTMINAYNFVDGSDGLSGSLACIALVAVAIVGGLSSPAGAAALIVAAAILGFLVFNLPMGINNHLRSFMGDAGSTLLGFSIVWTTIGISQGDARVISPVHCLWFAAIPIFDFMTCFVRRIANRRSPFSPGRDHFHHILLRGGLSGRQALTVLFGFQLIYAAVGVFGYLWQVSDVAMFSAWAVVGVTQRTVFLAIARYHRAFRIRRQVERRKFATSTN